MTSNRPQRPVRREAQDTAPEKPYALVPFPKQRPFLKAPVGHHRYTEAGYHGKLHLTLTVQTALHVSTGIVAMGSDVGSRVPLIKTMTRDLDQQLIIQGSSLKGCVRAIYEAITNSTLAVVTGRYRQKMPKDRLPCTQKDRLCPASQVFGALDWQGLVHFTDARCESAKPVTGFMPSLYRPRPEAYFNGGTATGRKFYRHAMSAVDGGDRGIPVQQAGTEYQFKTELQFLNLTQAQLGTLLIALGQGEHKMALKLGGGKPIGMGTIQVRVPRIEVSQDVRARYTSYAPPEAETLTGEAAATFIEQATRQAKQSRLVEEPQLRALAEILAWPTTRTAPEGMY
ncbi:MAG: CRISPR-associated protein [Leptolyngbya sp. SIO4C1]|nr:CRISPR-associated protein [Leptolyngbya sp. SIO4C1]